MHQLLTIDSFQNKYILSTWIMSFIIMRNFEQSTLRNGFKLFSKFLTEYYFSIPKGIPKFQKCLIQVMGCLIQNNGPGFSLKILQNHLAILPFPWKKAFKAEPPGRKSRQSQCRNQCTAPGQRSHRNLFFMTPLYQYLSQCNILPLLQKRDQFLCLFKFIKFMIACHLLLNLKVIQKLNGISGVLYGNQIYLCKRIQNSLGHIPEISNGCST